MLCMLDEERDWTQANIALTTLHPPGGVLPYMGYIGHVWHQRVWFFSRFGQIAGVSISADFGHFGHK